MPAMEEIVEIPLNVIERGYYQPREYFDAEAMESTKLSIQAKGQKYPVIVRPIQSGNPLFDPAWPETHYELADGERRFRCCKELGFKVLKALIRDLSDEEMLDYTVTTNDSLPLNPIEKAMAFSRLAKDFGKSQEQIAKSFNLKQQQVSEYIRLLELPKEVQDLTARAVISVRHARELLKISDHEKMKDLAHEVGKKSISTRKLTEILKKDDKKKENSISIGDISFEKVESSPIKPVEEVHEWLVEENNVEKQQILHPKPQPGGIYRLSDKLNGLFIPKKSYFRMEMWLNMTLGSKDRPERWLSKLELSLLGGLLLASAALWLPIWISVPATAILGSFLIYLFVF
jgi:ParB/RepB/Spo0J family partition protein